MRDLLRRALSFLHEKDDKQAFRGVDITGDISKISSNPISLGGFSDIFTGEWSSADAGRVRVMLFLLLLLSILTPARYQVALKVIRVAPNSNDAEIIRKVSITSYARRGLIMLCMLSYVASSTRGRRLVSSRPCQHTASLRRHLV